MTRNSVKRHHFTILESDRDNLGKKPGFMTLRNSLEDSLKRRTCLEETLIHLKIIIQSEFGGIDELSYTVVANYFSNQ